MAVTMLGVSKFLHRVVPYGSVCINKPHTHNCATNTLFTCDTSVNKYVILPLITKQAKQKPVLNQEVFITRKQIWKEIRRIISE